MKRTWSVLSGPYLVETVDPSTMGRRSRWTPSRETSGPPWPPPSRPATLSISSMKMIPACSARRMASFCSRSTSISLFASSSVSTSSASGSGSRRRFVLRAPCGIMSRRLRTISSIPVPENTSTNEAGESEVSISTILSSSFPSRISLRRLSRVALSAGGSGDDGGAGSVEVAAPAGGRARGVGGRSTSRRRSSAFSRARGRRRSRSSSRSIETAVSARSRTIESTSRPT